MNDAGFSQIDAVMNTELELLQEIVELNIMTLMVLTRLLVPKMLERGFGKVKRGCLFSFYSLVIPLFLIVRLKVLNVASIVAYYVGPHQAVYNASKSFVLSLSNALSLELKV